MKKVLLLVAVILALSVSVSAQDQLINVAGRIFAYPNKALYASVYQEVTDEGAPLFAPASASYAVKSDAVERLAKALEAFQMANPQLYQAVMTDYGLTVIASQENK